MSAVAPYAEILFCVVPWDADYKGVCDGASRAWIATMALPTAHGLGYETYVRRDQPMRLEVEIAEIIGANYVMYRNRNHENNWWYAFITDIKYINEGLTEISIQTDIYQTFRSQLSVLPSFTVREHVNDDSIGANTIPEGLETGEFVNSHSSAAGLGALAVVVAALKLLSDGSNAEGTYQNGLFTGVQYYIYPVHPSTGTDADALTALKTTISGIISRSGGFDNILSVFTVPLKLYADTLGYGGAMISSPSYSGRSLAHTAPSRPAHCDGYYPRNNKLLTHPYTFLYAYNNVGSASVYRYEHFSGTPEFAIYGGIGPDPQVKLVPTNKLTDDTNAQDNTEESLAISGWPVCLWSGNAWASYMAAHPGAVAQGVAGAAMAVMGLVTGGGGVLAAGAVMGGAMTAFSSVSAIVDKLIAPPVTGGHVASAPANIAGGIMDVFFSSRTVRNEYARVIDDYFTAYGYKINRVKAPNLKGRKNWNYVQTVDAAVKGGMPAADRKVLAAMLDRGVTIWHDPVKYGDYTQTNEVV